MTSLALGSQFTSWRIFINPVFFIACELNTLMLHKVTLFCMFCGGIWGLVVWPKIVMLLLCFFPEKILKNLVLFFLLLVRSNIFMVLILLYPRKKNPFDFNFSFSSSPGPRWHFYWCCCGAAFHLCVILCCPFSLFFDVSTAAGSIVNSLQPKKIVESSAKVLILFH